VEVQVLSPAPFPKDIDMAAHAFDLMTLLDAPGVGPGRVRKLLKHWRSTPDVPVMEDRLIKSVLTPAQIAALPECRDRVRRHWHELLKHNVRMLSIIDTDYPEGLRDALGESAPVLLAVPWQRRIAPAGVRRLLRFAGSEREGNVYRPRLGDVAR